MSLTPEHWRLVNELFDRALDTSPGDWPGIVAEAQRHHGSELAEELEALLKAHAQSPAFLETPVASLTRHDMLSRLGRLLGPLRAFTPGERLDDFRIERLLGEGSFARVYLATELSLDRQVALKISANAGREARTMAGLEHDHIVAVFHETTSQTHGARIICMQYVQGPNLAELIDGLARVPVEERSGAKILELVDAAAGPTLFNAQALHDRQALEASDYESACLWIGTRLAEALAFAHERGILHLDVKPANILVNRYGRPMLTDFNVALTPSDLAAEDSSVIGGTLSYMSPEHHEAFTTKDTARMGRIDRRSDIYALAVVLAELLTCQKLRRRVDHAAGVMALEGAEGLPEDVRGVLHTALRLAPEEREGSARAFGEALDCCRTLRRVRASLPARGPWIERAGRFPLATTVGLMLLPQIAGSFVNFMYSVLRIAQDLTPAQQDAFVAVLLPYNFVFYPIAIAYMWNNLRIVTGHLKRRRDVPPPPGMMAKLRRRLLRISWNLVLATTIGWLPGAYLFPAWIDYAAGPIDGLVYFHFMTSFISSWLIALTYSFLLLESVVLIVLYPRFWTGHCRLTDARVELEPVSGRIKLFQILAGMIPLAGAAMIVGAGPEVIDPERFYTFQIMVVGMISLGMCGFVFAMKTTENVKATVSAFMGATFERGRV
jgi:hypothetical protein